MKHKISITVLLMCVFLVTQLIGLAVIHAYSPREIIKNGEAVNVTLPYGMQPPETKPEVSLVSILIAMAIAVSLILILSKIKAVMFLRIWFFVVVIIAISITLNSVLMYPLNLTAASIISLLVAIPLAFYKVFRGNIYIHNLTELIIYPGISAVFVPILNIWTVIILFVVISLYDIYAVWISGFMQKMAKFQMNQLKIFSGFFVPYLSKKTRQEMKRLKQLQKTKKGKKRGKKIKVSVAILGGGDVVFPIIMAGVVLRAFGFLHALFIVIGATLALLSLFLFSRKGKFYPAMPYITAGCLAGLALGFLA